MNFSPRARLRRLAVVFSVALRMKIVVELYMREMSARQFHAEFGGGKPARVSQNFKALWEDSWLTLVREEGPGGTRRGAIEHFYRATELPFMNAETWALLPYSVRVASSWNMYKVIGPRMRGDVEAACAGDTPRRELTCRSFVMDSIGWTRSMAKMADAFAYLYDEQENAWRRSLGGGETLRRADVFLLGFQAPNAGLLAVENSLLISADQEPSESFSPRLARIMRDEIRRELLSDMNSHEVSQVQFKRKLKEEGRGQRVDAIFHALERDVWIAKGRTVTGGSRRGAREQFYQPVKPSMAHFDPCSNPPKGLFRSERWATFEQLCGLVEDAMIAETFDLQADRIMAWSLIRLDETGMRNVIALLDRLEELFISEEAAAVARIKESGEMPVTMVGALGAFDAPKETEKAP